MIRGPRDHIDRPLVQKQRMGAEINVLTAKVPEIGVHGGLVSTGPNQLQMAQADAVGRGDRGIKVFIAQTPADLRLADPTVAKHIQLDRAIGSFTRGEVLLPPAESRQCVVENILSAGSQFRGRGDQPIGTECLQFGP